MQAMTSDEAKTLACELTSRRRTPDELKESLRYFRGNLERAVDEQSRETWQAQVDSIEAWIASEAYRNGDYAEGIDSLILELTEWRAMIYAFEGVDTENSPFGQYTFFSQWAVGAVYAIFSLIGKLNSRDPRDNSLRNLWAVVQPFIAIENACEADELADIDHRLNSKSGQFKTSRALQFRNTVVAHNEKSIVIAWEELDNDIQTLVRIWSLVVSWASFVVIAPFRSTDAAFLGLDVHFTESDLIALKAKRKEYLDRMETWCRTHLHSGQPDPGRGPFASISVTSRVFGN